MCAPRSRLPARSPGLPLPAAPALDKPMTIKNDPKCVHFSRGKFQKVCQARSFLNQTMSSNAAKTRFHHMREDDLFTVRVMLHMTHDVTDLHVSCVVVGVLWTLRNIRAREVPTLRRSRRHRPNRCTTLEKSRKLDFDIFV